MGAEYDSDLNAVGVTLSVLTLPDDQAPEPADPRRQIILTGVGRVVAVLSTRHADPLQDPAEPFAIAELLTVVQSFGGQPVYGWDFLNGEDHGFRSWSHHLSLDFTPPHGSLENRLFLFQEGSTDDRALDLWVWFSDLLICDSTGNSIPLADFISGGKRWWDALYARDPRTNGHGMVPGSAC